MPSGQEARSRRRDTNLTHPFILAKPPVQGGFYEIPATERTPPAVVNGATKRVNHGSAHRTAAAEPPTHVKAFSPFGSLAFRASPVIVSVRNQAQRFTPAWRSSLMVSSATRLFATFFSRKLFVRSTMSGGRHQRAHENHRSHCSKSTGRQPFHRRGTRPSACGTAPLSPIHPAACGASEIAYGPGGKWHLSPLVDGF